MHLELDMATQEIYWLAEYPEELDEIDPNDLWSLKARLQDIDDPELDALWTTVCAMTASHC
jgi:hypothetical protein